MGCAEARHPVLADTHTAGSRYRLRWRFPAKGPTSVRTAVVLGRARFARVRRRCRPEVSDPLRSVRSQRAETSPPARPASRTAHAPSPGCCRADRPPQRSRPPRIPTESPPSRPSDPAFEPAPTSPTGAHPSGEIPASPAARTRRHLKRCQATSKTGPPATSAPGPRGSRALREEPRVPSRCT